LSRPPRRNPLPFPFIVLFLAALLACGPRTAGPSPTPGEPAAKATVPSPAAEADTIGAGDRTLQLGPTVDLARALVSSGGGTLRVDAPDDPMHGLSVEIPPNAYPDDVAVGLSYRTVDGHSLGDRFVPRSPLIQVEMGEGYAAKTVALTIPTEIPEGQVPVALTFAPGSGRLEAMRVLAKSASSVTVGARRIGNVVLTSIDEWFLFEHNFETGFRHGVDSWQFTNWGAYPSPRGNCTGMTMSAMAYYVERRSGEGKPPLYGLYDNHDNPFYATRGLGADDRLAIRLVSMAQAQGTAAIRDDLEADDDLSQDEFLAFVLAEPERAPSPIEVYDAIVSAMFFTGEPQLIAVHAEKSGHALIAYKKVGNSIYLSDPNHPQAAEGANKIVYDPDTGQFEPYIIGRTPYPTIEHLGATSDWDMGMLSGLWQQFDEGTVGDGAFPAYTLGYSPPDGFWTPLENNMEVYDDELWFQVTSSAFIPRLTLYVESAGFPRQVDQAEGNDRVHAGAQPGVNAFGFLIEAKSTEGYSYAEGPGVRGHTWVDFRWYNLELAEEETPTVEPTPTGSSEQWTAEQCNALPALTFTLGEQTIDPPKTGASKDAPCQRNCWQWIDVTTDYEGEIDVHWLRREYDHRGEITHEVWNQQRFIAGVPYWEPNPRGTFFHHDYLQRSEACELPWVETSEVVAVYRRPECRHLWYHEVMPEGARTLGLPVYVPENPCRPEGAGTP
jgi:hypothetical protein